MRAAVAGAALVALAGATTACGGSSGGSAGDATSTAARPTTTSTTASTGGSTTTAAGATSTSASATTTTGLPDASEAQHSAPSDGTGTALLRAVRVGRNPGFERIVFEFAGSAVPGYRVQWVDGPILADGSGEAVDVAGDAHLEIVMQPASGVDLSAPQLTVVYDGPDRIPVAGQTELITDLVRTGDFESVLTWVAGATEQVPFRVLRLTDPTRVVVDLQTT
jgi:hypothetical protein